MTHHHPLMAITGIALVLTLAVFDIWYLSQSPKTTQADILPGTTSIQSNINENRNSNTNSK